jgi:hypothetical protein
LATAGMCCFRRNNSRRTETAMYKSRWKPCSKQHAVIRAKNGI